MSGLKHSTLGLKNGAKLNQTEASIGWCLFDRDVHLPKARTFGEPLALILRQVPHGGHVDLVGYSDDAAFTQSQAARDGLTRAEHIAMLNATISDLRVEGRTGAIKWVSSKK